MVFYTHFKKHILLNVIPDALHFKTLNWHTQYALITLKLSQNQTHENEAKYVKFVQSLTCKFPATAAFETNLYREAPAHGTGWVHPR